MICRTFSISLFCLRVNITLGQPPRTHPGIVCRFVSEVNDTQAEAGGEVVGRGGQSLKLRPSCKG